MPSAISTNVIIHHVWVIRNGFYSIDPPWQNSPPPPSNLVSWMQNDKLFGRSFTFNFKWTKRRTSFAQVHKMNFLREFSTTMTRRRPQRRSITHTCVTLPNAATTFGQVTFAWTTIGPRTFPNWACLAAWGLPQRRFVSVWKLWIGRYGKGCILLMKILLFLVQHYSGLFSIKNIYHVTEKASDDENIFWGA